MDTLMNLCRKSELKRRGAAFTRMRVGMKKRERVVAGCFQILCLFCLVTADMCCFCKLLFPLCVLSSHRPTSTYRSSTTPSICWGNLGPSAGLLCCSTPEATNLKLYTKLPAVHQHLTTSRSKS